MDNYDLDKIRGQILEICDSGCCNMLDTAQVQRTANDRGFYDLVIFIEENKRGYSNFIFYGKFE